MDHVRFETHVAPLRTFTGDGAELYATVQQAMWNPRPGSWCELFYLDDDNLRQAAYPQDGALIALDDVIHHDQRVLLAHDGGKTYDGGPPLVPGDPAQGGRNVYDPRVPAGPAPGPAPGQGGTGGTPESNTTEPDRAGYWRSVSGPTACYT